MNLTTKQYLKAFIIVFFMFSLLSFSQSGVGKGRLKGTVLLEDNSKVSGAEVKIELTGAIKKSGTKPEIIPIKKENRTVFNTITNEKGEWIFSTLGYGYWKITITYKDYPPVSTSLEVVTMGRNKNVKLFLRKSVKKLAQEQLSSDVKSIDVGIKLLKDKKYDEALLAFQSFLKKQPDIYQVHFYLGKCHKEKGEFDKAISEYNMVIEKAKDNKEGISIKAKSLAGIGEVYVRKNDLKKGQEYFVKSIKMNPKDEILAYNVGEIYFGSNNSDGAIKYYKIASEIKPKWAIPHMKLGYAYLNKGDIKSAVVSFKKFLELDPNSPEADGIKAVVDSLKGAY
ncbi:MAG: tetratricopeptide repeat protein [Acidobacteriota bacterium]